MLLPCGLIRPTLVGYDCLEVRDHGTSATISIKHGIDIDQVFG